MPVLDAAERWLPIVGYEGLYEVSDLGRVRSLTRIDSLGRTWKGQLRKPQDDGRYFNVVLYTDGKGETWRIHNLVMETFVGPAPPGMEVCHGEGRNYDNRLVNLRHDTRIGNSSDKERDGTLRRTNAL